MRVVILAAALILGAGGAEAEEPFQAVFVGVEDGDTMVVKRGSELLTLNLAAVDAPEMGQAFGEEAAAFLASEAAKGELMVTPVGLDPSGVPTASVTVGGLDLGLLLLQAGAAWHDLEDRSEHLTIAQIVARTNKQGLWAEDQPKEPWRWRAEQATRPTPTPRPRTLGELAKNVELAKDEDGKAVIEQPAAKNAVPRSAAADREGDGSSWSPDSVHDIPGLYGPQCCCEFNTVQTRGEGHEEATVYRMIDEYSCERAVAVEFVQEGTMGFPQGCTHEYLCDEPLD